MLPLPEKAAWKIELGKSNLLIIKSLGLRIFSNKFHLSQGYGPRSNLPISKHQYECLKMRGCQF